MCAKSLRRSTICHTHSFKFCDLRTRSTSLLLMNERVKVRSRSVASAQFALLSYNTSIFSLMRSSILLSPFCTNLAIHVIRFELHSLSFMILWACKICRRHEISDRLRQNQALLVSRFCEVAGRLDRFVSLLPILLLSIACSP